MRVEEIFVGGGGAGLIDGGLPVPVVPGYGEEKYDGGGSVSIYNDADGDHQDDQGENGDDNLDVIRPRYRAILKVLDKDGSEGDSSESELDRSSDDLDDGYGDESDYLPNASAYGLGLNDRALRSQL